jgi:hypothetical protein
LTGKGPDSRRTVMAEQIFRSPNFYEREIDLSAPSVGGPVGTPAGVIAPANKGPAFVPVTFANFNEFVTTFGNLDPKYFGPYAVNEFLKNRSSLTYMRVLGAGSNTTVSDISDTDIMGTVKNAGFKLDGVAAPHDALGRHAGAVQLIAVQHDATANEAFGMPMFTDNDTLGGNVNSLNLIRGMVMMPETARFMILDGNEATTSINWSTNNDEAQVKNVNNKPRVKIVISSSLGSAYATDDGLPGIRIFSASFDPSADDYFAKILNTDPDRFYDQQHYLAADFAVDDQVARVDNDKYVAVLSGSALTSSTSGDPTLAFRKVFGAYNTRFKTPTSPWFISQPFGKTEHDLFRIESLDDGEYANKLYKISIANIKASTDETNKYGTFNLQVRDWNDTDVNPVVLEQFTNCTLDPDSDNYIAKLIGDRKVSYHFDAVDPRERRIVATGTYPNQSRYVRVVMADSVTRKLVPVKCLPFGFHGPSLLKTNDKEVAQGALLPSQARLAGVLPNAGTHFLSGSVLPPVPFRYKVTRGNVSTVVGLPAGAPGPNEVTLPALYWGVKFERNGVSKDIETLNPNVVSEKNPLLGSLTKFMGIEKLDALHTGSAVDSFNNNKFTLARVAFGNELSNSIDVVITGSAAAHMKDAAYIRNAVPNPTDYTVDDGVMSNRITFATLLDKSTAGLSGVTPAAFNRFAVYTKFTTFMLGGFDGTNLLDRDARRLNDKSVSFDGGSDGGASTGYTPDGFSSNPAGQGKENNGVNSYLTAVNIMTDPFTAGVNILTLPGIREPYVMDQTSKKVRDYGLAMHLMDIPAYDDSAIRLYDDSTTKPNIKETANQFDALAIDNNYVATYFPDVFIDDTVNVRRVKVPASVAALGALGFNDRVAYPWFAPAGFNRAALDFVKNVHVRLNVDDRDRLYDSRINPIATFPRLGYVIYGQKTLQINKSALDRVNVRRLLLEVKRIIIGIAQKIVFEQNTPAVRNRFVSESVFQLSLIQTQAGVEAFQVVMNETNNTQDDIDLNKLNGRIVVVPTRAIEFIAIDFIVTNAGVQFV